MKIERFIYERKVPICEQTVPIKMKGLTKKESEVLLKLLKEFTRDYNANSISKIVNITPRGALKILKNLAKENLIIGRKLGKAVFYKINFDDYYTLKILETLLISEAREKAARWIYEFKSFFKNTEIVIIFGSIVKNPAKAKDIDLLLVFKKEKNKDLMKSVQEKKAISSKTIHVIKQTPKDLQNNLNKKDPVILSAIKNGFVLHGHNKLLEVIKNVRSS